MMTSQDKLIKLYEDAFKELQEEILKRETSGRSVAYQKRLLDKLKAVIKKLKKQTPSLVQQLLSSAANAGAQLCAAQLSSQLGYTLEPTVNSHTLEVLAQNTTDQLTNAVNHVGRRYQDAIRSAAIEAANRKMSSGQTLRDMQRNILEKLQQVSPGGVPTKHGTMRLDAYAKMVARSTNAEIRNTVKLDMATEHGYDLAQFTYHTPTCELCAQYENRVFALTREAAKGKYKGPSGDPLYFPYLFDTAFADGYNNIHPNCRHSLVIIVAALKTPEWLANMSQKSMLPFTDPRSAQVRDAYAKAQAVNRERWQDRRQWEKMRFMIPDETPASFAAFRSMKRANGEKWRYMQLDYNRQLQLERHPETQLPYVETATAAKEKFTGYLFNPENKKGYAKGLAITHRLGYNINNWPELQAAILQSAGRYPVKYKRTDQHGDRFEQFIVLYGKKNKPANMKVAWILKDKIVKMTTCFLEEYKWKL